jgi:predicted RNA-binding Zn-ribbon protein involved in translation (DUF1610 family)
MNPNWKTIGKSLAIQINIPKEVTWIESIQVTGMKGKTPKVIVIYVSKSKDDKLVFECEDIHTIFAFANENKEHCFKVGMIVPFSEMVKDILAAVLELNTMAPDEKLFVFTCPFCGGHSLGMTIISSREKSIERIVKNESDNLDWEEYPMKDKRDSWYVCRNCGKQTGYESMEELLANNLIREEK